MEVEWFYKVRDNQVRSALARIARAKNPASQERAWFAAMRRIWEEEQRLKQEYSWFTREIRTRTQRYQLAAGDGPDRNFTPRFSDGYPHSAVDVGSHHDDGRTTHYVVPKEVWEAAPAELRDAIQAVLFWHNCGVYAAISNMAWARATTASLRVRERLYGTRVCPYVLGQKARKDWADYLRAARRKRV